MAKRAKPVPAGAPQSTAPPQHHSPKRQDTPGNPGTNQHAAPHTAGTAAGQPIGAATPRRSNAVLQRWPQAQQRPGEAEAGLNDLNAVPREPV